MRQTAQKTFSARGPSVAQAEGSPPEPDEIDDRSGQAFTIEELGAASGLPLAVVKDLESFGMLDPRHTADGRIYGEDDLAIARLVKGFLRFGLEPRHLKMYQNFAEREAAVFEQIATPMMRQRNPEARKVAHATLAELAGLSRELRQVLLRVRLRSYLAE